jgi:hypothetical protein
LNFSGAGANATITISGVGPNDRVQIAVTLTGGNARVDSEHHSDPEYSGRITSIDAAARSFRMGDFTVKVPAAAVIRHGSQTLEFAALKVGDEVEVHGTKDGTTITATEVEIDNGDEVDGDNSQNDNSTPALTGVVSALAGTCPTVTFVVENTKVSAAAATSYQNGACAAVKNGVHVQVKGNRQADGSVAATRISMNQAQNDNSASVLTGAVSALAGTCPAVTFMVENTKVTAAAATYERGACAGVKNGMRIQVKGTRQADGSVAATRILIAD